MSRIKVGLKMISAPLSTASWVNSGDIFKSKQIKMEKVRYRFVSVNITSSCPGVKISSQARKDGFYPVKIALLR